MEGVLTQAITIRDATLSDADRIKTIYNYYIKETFITFEIEPLETKEIERRMLRIFALGLPWLVLCVGEKVVGYSYASHFRERAAYLHTVSCATYLDKDYLGKGLGEMLVERLLDLLGPPIHAIVAAISLPNERSVALHEKFGFEKVAHFKEVGFKKETWLDTGNWELLR